MTKQSASKWGFGTDKRKGQVNRDQASFPGAGSYTIGSRISEGPKYGVGLKLNTDTSPTKHNPGPGTYDLQNAKNPNQHTSQQFSVGKASRSPAVNKSLLGVPGPGNYQSSLVDKRSAPRFGFGSGGRAVVGSVMTNPGPGSYQALEFVGKEAPSPSVHAKLSYKPIEQTGGKTPGPGAYDASTKHRRTAPSYSPGLEQRKGPAAKHEGPAANHYNPSNTFTTKQAASWGFGSELRGKDKKTLSPGPGNYQIKPIAFDTDKPKFHMGIKLKPTKETTAVPGAGTYEPVPEKTKKNGPAFSMKMKLGSSLGGSTVSPGPGNYEIHQKNKTSAPNYGFGTSTRKQPKGLDVPGPGAYKINCTVSDVQTYAMPNRAEEFRYV